MGVLSFDAEQINEVKEEINKKVKLISEGIDEIGTAPANENQVVER